MKIININSYYFSSTLYKHMEESLKARDIKLQTYVPVIEGYKYHRKDLPEHIYIKELFSQLDRFFFFKKQNKIYNYFRKNFNVNSNTILHAHSLFTNGYIAYRNYLDNKTPYIVAVRSTDINLFFEKIIYLRKLGIKILENAKRIIFLSKPYREICINKYVPKSLQQKIKNKCLVIPNGIDPFWFNNIFQGEKSIQDTLNLIFVGNISRRKNITKLIEACDLLKSQNVMLKLDVVGKTKKQKFKKLIISRNYTKYLGFLKKEELRDVYRENHILVLPSITETFGLVYPEAMSQGLPVIYTKGQGFDKQLSDGVVGYPVISEDAKDIAENILKIKKAYKKLSANAIKYVHKFDWEKISTKYKKIYYDILT